MADTPTLEDQAAADKAAADKAATDKALTAKWKKASYAEIATEHVRLKTAGQLDEAAAFHDKFVKTFKD